LLHPNLGSIQPELLHAFEGKAVSRQYRRGTTVYRRGRPVRGLFLIEKGRVRVSLSEGGSGVSLNVAGPGALLGLGETVSGTPYEATVETLDPCQISFLRREDFLGYLRQNCGICLQLVQQLSEELHQLYQQYRTVGGPATRIRKPRGNGLSQAKASDHKGPLA
jgi:CRP/FNR family transcriptional regulator